MTDFTSSDDIINVSDICDRVEELRSERDNHVENPEECEFDDEAMTELVMLEELLDDVKGYGGDHQWEGDWYPATLINENHFEAAMDELLEDIGDIPKDLPSYLTITIDYDELKQDYSEVEFDGTTYYYR